MITQVAECLYTLVLRSLIPIYIARLWWRGRVEPLYRTAWRERFGYYSLPLPPRGISKVDTSPQLLWIHAVSLGETQAAAALINALRVQMPDLHLLLTHGTATGRAAGAGLLKPGDSQVWLPCDLPGALERFLSVHRPVMGVLMETEAWPNLLKVAERKKVPIVLANARLSEKSLRRGLRFKILLGKTAQRLRHVLAQTQEDAQRLRQMGVHSIDVCGNLKFDAAPSPEMLARGQGWAALSQKALVLAASTREGEELLLLQAWKNAQKRAFASPIFAITVKQPRLFIVPRHPQRFDEVAQMVYQAKLTLSRRSEWRNSQPQENDFTADVWLGDSVGEMPAYFASAKIGLLGGSFMPFGGHNLIEAAACGCPLVIGPSTFNFKYAAEQSLATGASLQVKDMDAAVVQSIDLLQTPKVLQAMAEASFIFANASRGSAKRQAEAILRIWRETRAVFVNLY
jgi:3-deoxy-D-manno-octulosonic-acid transferase